MLTLTATDMEEGLLRLAQPPAELYVEGAPLSDILAGPRLGIVGSRKVTPYGRGVTAQLAASLGAKGIIIISGLALGVDSIAHQGCLDGGGCTLAVLPGSITDIYPRTHHALAQRILGQGGTLLSEYAHRGSPQKFQFIARNRLIAALSDAILVTEAAAKSGSLHTAEFALELGKPVLAVPGNITSLFSEGCNNLIKAGAIPVTCEQDILDAMGWSAPSDKPKKVMGSTPEESIIISLLQNGVDDGHELLALSELPLATFNQAVTMLEITGRIKPTGANHWTL